MDKIDDWNDYFGDSTIYYCRRRGVYVHFPDESNSQAAGAAQEDPADAVRQGLAENPGDDKA